MRHMRKLAGACGFAVAGFLGSTASAAVVTFDGESAGTQTPFVSDGFVFDTVRIVNGNCLDAPCLALNDNESTTITREGGGTFSLASFWFQLLGAASVNTLTVTADGVDLLFPESSYPHNNGGQIIDLSANADFMNITSLVFSTFGGGNVRIDDIELVPSEIPIPGALPLMLSALAGGYLVRRRKAKAAA